MVTETVLAIVFANLFSVAAALPFISGQSLVSQCLKRPLRDNLDKFSSSGAIHTSSRPASVSRRKPSQSRLRRGRSEAGVPSRSVNDTAPAHRKTFSNSEE